jgi:hypothetical protein
LAVGRGACCGLTAIWWALYSANIDEYSVENYNISAIIISVLTFKFFTCGLFKAAVSMSEYAVSNDKMASKYELEMMLKETVVA